MKRPSVEVGALRSTLPRASFHGIRAKRWAVAVDAVPEFLPNLEVRQSFRFDVHRLTRSWVPPPIGAVFADSKAAEATDLDALAALKGIAHGAEDLIHDRIGTADRQLHLRGDGLDEGGLGLGHAPAVYPKVARGRMRGRHAHAAL